MACIVDLSNVVACRVVKRTEMSFAAYNSLAGGSSISPSQLFSAASTFGKSSAAPAAPFFFNVFWRFPTSAANALYACNHVTSDEILPQLFVHLDKKQVLP